MLRVLHLADLHIGVENYGHFDVAAGMHTRLMDFLARFDEAIDVGIAAKVDLVLIAGDMFKNRDPQPRHQREFAVRIRRVVDAGIPVLMLIGNHDVAPGRDTTNSVAVYEGLQYPNVHVARKAEIVRYETANGRLAVVCVPWILRELLLANNEELRTASLSEQEPKILQIVERFIQTSVDTLLAEDPDRPIVVTYHGTVSGATTGIERMLTLGRDIVMPPAALTPAGVDYVALGHVHKHQLLRPYPPVVYPGSIERIDFGEMEEHKGCVLVSFAGKQASWEFVPLQARPFVRIDVDVTTYPDSPTERVLTAIERRTLQGAVVSVIVTISEAGKALFSYLQVRTALSAAGAAHIARVVLETPQQKIDRTTSPDHSGDIPAPAEALRQYLEKQQLPATELAALMDMGLTIIAARDDA
jgi:DNA repair protein SbcD/Mre11